MIRLPDPSNDMRRWAADLVRVLGIELERIDRNKQDRGRVHLLPEFALADLPSPTPPGQIALITNGIDGTTLVRSNGTAWVQMLDGGPLA